MKSIVLGLLISTAVTVSGCATTSGGSYCDIARAIRPSVQDVMTEDTKRQIVAENEKLASLCGVRPNGGTT